MVIQKVFLTLHCQDRGEDGLKKTGGWLKMTLMTYESLQTPQEMEAERKEKREVGVEMDVDAFIS